MTNYMIQISLKLKKYVYYKIITEHLLVYNIIIFTFKIKEYYSTIHLDR